MDFTCRPMVHKAYHGIVAGLCELGVHQHNRGSSVRALGVLSTFSKHYIVEVRDESFLSAS